MRVRPAVVLFALGLLPGPAASIVAAGQNVTFEVSGETVRAYLSYPVGTTAVPGIVLVHEMWGLNEQILGVADRLSELGYVVVAPDLYRGKLAADPGLAQDMVRALKEERGVAIVNGAIELLRSRMKGANKLVAAVGFGIGGRISLLAALRGSPVQATAIFYGDVPNTPEELAPLKIPVLGIFGAKDMSVHVEDAKKFEASLKEAGKDATIIVFESTAHDFFNEARADYEPEIAKDAWVRLRDWLATKLVMPLTGGSASSRPAAIAATPSPTP